MPLANPILNPHNPIHVYRHLLREISYLPPPARPWASSHASGRFRARPPGPRFPAREREQTLRKRIHVAHGALFRLRAANSGHVDRMREILFHAFGRKGRRRRELVEELVYKGGKAAKDAIASGLKEAPLAEMARMKVGAGAGGGGGGEAIFEYMESVTARSKSEKRWDWLDKWDTENIKRWLASQKKHEAETKTAWPFKSPLKVTDPEKTIPPLNNWQREWPEKTYRTKLAKAWKHVSGRIQPPLPKEEWEMLRRLTYNQDIPDDWKIPPRRKLVPSWPRSTGQDTDAGVNESSSPTPTGAGEPSQPWDWVLYATKPVRQIERTRAPRNIRMSGDTDIGPYGRELRGPAPDGRWIRRVYHSIWEASAMLDIDPKTSKPTITWGKKQHHATTASSSQAELFVGVNAQGKKVYNAGGG